MRSFFLPEDADRTKVADEYKDGVLYRSRRKPNRRRLKKVA